MRTGTRYLRRPIGAWTAIVRSAGLARAGGLGRTSRANPAVAGSITSPTTGQGGLESVPGDKERLVLRARARGVDVLATERKQNPEKQAEHHGDHQHL